MIATDSLISVIPWGREWPQYDRQYNLVITVPPAVEPVSFSDMEDWQRLDQTFDQQLCTGLLIAGRRYVETATRLTLIQTTYTCSFDSFDYLRGMKLPRRPVTGVSSITYLDQSGNQQTLSPSAYYVNTKSTYTRIVPSSNQVWPQTLPGGVNSVTVTFTAGATSDPTQVDELAKVAIKAWASAQYENREAVNSGKTGAILPHTFDAILTMLSAPEVG